SQVVADPMEVAGVNDRAQLAVAEAELRDRTNERWMRRGVTMLDPERTYIDATVTLAADVTLFPGTILQGATSIGAGAQIGPDTRLIDCSVGEGAVVEQTVGRHAEIGAEARVGPFASLPPGAQVPPGAVTGPFFGGP
ncbi:MAG: bifunctional UDP-N-acetylglucosamine diphosphorylase/glucosamine-1-phosphate N-acetyltransferase GlmU, partial [Acidimicrobiales bacterium]